MRSAVVLADRNATRSDVDGTALVSRTVERVDPAVDEVVVSCRDEQREAISSALTDCRIAVDPVPGGGPVAGIRSGCRVARGRETFVTACGIPHVRPSLVERLFDAREEDGAVSSLNGHRQPLVATYKTDAAIEAAGTTLGLGSGAVTDLLDRLDVTTVPVAGPAQVRESSDS